MHTFALLTLVGAALAAPTTQVAKRQEGPSTNATTGAYIPEVPIHSSCNATERAALQAALADVTNITQTAINYVAQYGAESPMFQRYFGNGDYTTVLGSLSALIQSNKDGMLLRCDNPDGNCQQEGWNGHWRGSNATAETVICPLSYQTRKPLSQMCDDGYTVANSSASYYFATDLIHRMYHVPQISDSEVEHYADSYQECLELAANNATWAPYNTHTIQYFVADVFALQVARPGVGCTGELPEVLTAPAPAASGSPTATSSAAQSCHTHADGEVHCV